MKYQNFTDYPSLISTHGLLLASYSMSICEADLIPGLVRTLDYIECYSLVFHMTLVWKV